MKVSLASKNRKLFIELPIVPDDLEWGQGMNNKVIETINHGEINLSGTRKLISLSISSFFPNNETVAKRYTYARNYVAGEDIVYQIQKWRDDREPIRLVITSKSGRSLLNILVLIDDFKRGKDRASDIPYTLDISEYVG